MTTGNMYVDRIYLLSMGKYVAMKKNVRFLKHLTRYGIISAVNYICIPKVKTLQMSISW